MRARATRAVAIALLALGAGCGGASHAGNDGATAADAGAADAETGGAGDANDDVSDATTTDGDGGLACGATSCGEDQLCVYEYCGGGPVQCEPAGDGGTCADGWTYQTFGCPRTSGPGCFPPPCTSPAPHCTDRPAACDPAVTCACLPSSVCDGIPCASVSNGRTVICGAA